MGFHSFKKVLTQSVHGVCGGFSETPLSRDILKCECCDKVKKVGYDIATNAHLDDTLNWKPELV